MSSSQSTDEQNDSYGFLAICPCFVNFFKRRTEQGRLRIYKQLIREGCKFRRRTFTFGFGIGSERVEVKLKEGADSVLMWRKDGDSSYHEVDLNDVKTVEAKGRASLMLSSRTGDLLLELEAEEEATRNEWVSALTGLVEDLRRNPQASIAHKSVKDRVKEQAQKQKHFAKRSIELQQQKKEAESRKAKYMQETGGLKYTAMAMANRQG
ncbi:unnamed protein product [Choristocarpus tenellus]